MIDPIVGMKWLTKVLMDGGSGLNIMYAEMLDAMGVDRARIWPTGAPFQGIVPGKQAVPLGQIDLPITFEGPSNYRIIHHFGVPNSIITDNGTQFTEKKFLQFCDEYHIRVDWAFVAHPRMNGQVKRANDMVL